MSITPEQASMFQDAFGRLVANVENVLVGKTFVIRLGFVALLSEGHLLLEDYPGTGKTSFARAIAQSVQGSVSRIQFTPDLLPGDITGVSVFDQSRGEFSFHGGPVFSNIVLADEINRASPKTQAALLEVMEEHRVTVDGVPHPVPSPFMVVATQNPIESQGVYPLPEAQLDRFLFKLIAAYPSEKEEAGIVARFGIEQGPARPENFGIEAVTDRDALQASIAAVKAVTLAPENVDYVVRLVRATRSHSDLAIGASPRAAVLLGNASRVHAALDGRDYVVPDDVKALATAVLRHRLILSAAAEIEGREVEAIVSELIESTEAPR